MATVSSVQPLANTDTVMIWQSGELLWARIRPAGAGLSQSRNDIVRLIVGEHDTYRDMSCLVASIAEVASVIN